MTPPQKHSEMAHIQTQLEPPVSYILALMARVVECWSEAARQEARMEHLRKELRDALRSKNG